MTSPVDQLADQMWRLHNLYWIINKDGKKVPFVPNWAQTELYENMLVRNLVPKGRQFGVSTCVGILQLDCAIFQPGFSSMTVCHDLEAAEKLFYRNIKLPYDNLPESIREMVGCYRDRARELRFTNESMVSVGTSGRSGSFQLMHVSEFGKICAKYPDRAREIVTGAFEAAGKDNIIIVESTAEGAHGYFHDYCMAAHRDKLEGTKPGPLDWNLIFLPWWKHPEYVLPPSSANLTPELVEYFRKLKAERGIKLGPARKSWYAAKAKLLGDDVKREYPCIAGHVPILVPEGIVRMDQAKPDGLRVQRFMENGNQECLQIKTSLGYSLVCTYEHRVLTPDGFIEAQELSEGDKVSLGRWCDSASDYQTVSYSDIPCVESRIRIDEDFAEFIGFFVGDGSYHANTLSVVCDRKDQDTVNRVINLIRKFVGEPATRAVGSKQGGTEVRIGCVRLESPFRHLGVIKTRKSGGIARCVAVPEAIKMSPNSVIAAFLRGLFEADGFAQRNGTGVKLHSKYNQFLSDVQLLLLRLGITSRVSEHNKKSGDGSLYIGYELSLRTNEAIEFAKTVGFVSSRKNARATQKANVSKGNIKKRLPIAECDAVVSITPAGNHPVYDIQTDNSQFSAGGIIVHNCYLEEAFEQSIKGAYYDRQMTKMREEGRICSVPHQPGVRVETWWDLGMDDATAIWFVQEVGRELRVINYIEASGEGLPYYARKLNELAAKHGYIYGEHVGPHDLSVREMGSGTSRFETAADLGLRFTIAPRTEIADGIEKMRNELGRMWIDKEKCRSLIASLDSYQKEWDDKRGTFKNSPLHNWASHGADAGRTGVTGRQYSVAPVAQVVQRSRAWGT